MLIDVDKETRGFRPSPEWMRRRYSELNSIFFGNKLGGCQFRIFTTGRGSQGRTLGFFHLTASNLKADRYNRRIYKYNTFSENIYVNYDNFVDICRPEICLNGNYSGTEYGFLYVLLHEMCHYYNYMKGFCPKQGHGPEFRSISSFVSNISEGLFNITRLANAEQVENLDLDDSMKQKAEKRLNNKKSSVSVVFEFRKNGNVHMTMTSNEKLMNLIVSNMYRTNYVSKIVICDDYDFIDFLFSLGYRKNMRTWRYWEVSDKEWLSKLETSNNKVLNNDKMNESKEKFNRITDSIITEVINNYINEREGNDSIDITSDMDLGMYSPFEYE